MLTAAVLASTQKNNTNERLWKMFRDNEPKVNAARKESRLFKSNTALPQAEVSSSRVLSLTRNIDLLKSKGIITELVDELCKTQSCHVLYKSEHQRLLKYTEELTKYSTDLRHRVEESKQKAKKAKDECDGEIHKESDLQREYEELKKLKKVPSWCTPTAGSSDPSPMAPPPTSVSSTPVAPPLPSSLQPSVNNKRADPRLSCSSQALEEKLKGLSSNRQTRLLLDEIDAQIIELRRFKLEALQKGLSKFIANDNETIAKLTAEQDDLLKKQTPDFKTAFAKLSDEQEKLCKTTHECQLLHGRIESLHQQKEALLEENKTYKQERVDCQKISAMMKTKQEQLKRKIQELKSPLAALFTAEQDLDTKHSVRNTDTADLSSSSVPTAPPLAPALLPPSSGRSTAHVQQATDCAPAPTDCAPASKTAGASPRASSALWKTPVVASATKTSSQRRSSTPVPRKRWR